MASGFDPNDPSTWSSVLGDTDSLRKLDVTLPNGVTFNNVNTPNDVEMTLKMIKELGLNSSTEIAKFLAGSAPRKTTQTSKQPEPQEGGMTLSEIIENYNTRKADKLSPKTVYEYKNYHQKFKAWIARRKSTEHYPLRKITREDISAYINDLKAKNISDNTIQQKYLASIGGLFDHAQTFDAYPIGEIPTRGHKLFTKRDKKKGASKTARRPYDDKDLELLFKPENLLKREKPDDFWLPLLALFTGGRISELCQLAVSDIKQINGIWSLSINDEDYKRVKTDAALREIPIHPQLLKLGFLDYVADASEFGGMLFPYLTADPNGNFSCTPSERYTKYRREIGITDPRKVFHSFRFTANNTLKKNGVPLEERCQFIGHEVFSTNSKAYSDPFPIDYLLENVSGKLHYESIDFDGLVYTKGRFLSELKRLCEAKQRFEIHKQNRLKREDRARLENNKGKKND